MLGKISKSLSKGINASTKAFKAGSTYYAKEVGNTLGRGAIMGAGLTASVGKTVGKGATNSAKGLIKSTVNAAGTLVREDKARSLIGFRMKKRGIALIAGAGMLTSAGKEAKSYYTTERQGRVDQYTTPYSPSLQPQSAGSGYQNFGSQAGANGDLVFALNKNRKG